MTCFSNGRLFPGTTIRKGVACAGLLLLVCGAFIVNDLLQLRGTARRELSAMENVVAAGSAHALALRDGDAAVRILRLLQGDERISAASLYARDEVQPLASYDRGETGSAPFAATRQPGIFDDGKSIVLIQSVVLDGQAIGTLAIRAGVNAMTSGLARRFSATALLFTCLLIGFLCTSSLPSFDLHPIAAFAETAGSHPPEPEDLSEQPAHEIVAREIPNLELAVAHSRAAETARMKDEFLANMSHKVRTPMNGVIAMAELALETDLTPQQRQYVAAAGTSAEILQRAIDDIIDFFRIEAGGLTLTQEEFSISETLYDVMQSVSPAAREKGLALLLNVHSDVPMTVLGDTAKFRRIMVSLIDNALKFTEAGRITVEAAPVFHSERIVGLHFQVRDTGIGLASGRFGRAIEPFEEEYDSSAHAGAGTGLGLAIANRLIGLMGGCFWLESEIGSGSIFHFTVTFEVPNGSAPVPLDLSDLLGASVLVADGSAITRRALQQLLSRWQVRPTLATSGAEAIDLLRGATAAGSPFNIVLVDRHMLGIDGGALAREIGEHPEVGRPLIMILSSISTVSVTDFTRDFDRTSYLVKPISQSTLLKAVSGAMHTVRDERQSAAPIHALTPGKPARILVVEDNLTSQAVAVSVLAKEGYDVTIARNGAEALEVYDRGGLDMILMDLQMPGMDGLEATRAIRLREADSGNHIAILALTANSTKDDRDRCIEAGLDDYVSKPFHVRGLRKTVGRWLNRRWVNRRWVNHGSPAPGIVPPSLDSAA